MKNPRWFQYADIVGPTAPCTQSSTQISDPYLQFTFRIAKSSSQAWAASESLEELIQMQISGPYPRVSDSESLGWAQEFTTLTISLGMLRLLVCRPHFESHCVIAFSVCVCVIAERKKKCLKFSCGLNSFKKLPLLDILKQNHIEYIFQGHINLYFINLLCSHLTEVFMKYLLTSTL